MSNIINGPNGPSSYVLDNGLGVASTYDVTGHLNGRWVCSGGSSPYAAYCAGSTQVYGFTVGQTALRVYIECDTVLSQCMNFGYDNFNRLTSRTVTTGAAQNFSYGYDRYGNRWSQNVTAGSGPTFAAAFSSSTNQINSGGYTYDAAGNITNDGSHAYIYDAEGNLLQVDTAQTATYVYDALNRRVRINEGSASYDLIFNPSGQWTTVWNGNTGVEDRSQFYWGPTPIAWYDNNTHFQHSDWSTVRMQTSYNGAVEGSYSSLPWGDALTGAGSGSDAYTGATAVNSVKHYAGLDHDYETNTEHAQFRNYSSTQGRWLSPDPYIGSYDFTNPQSFNRYTYALNNPLSFVDRSGLYCEYEDDADDGVLEDVDYNSTPGECSSTGGNWFADGGWASDCTGNLASCYTEASAIEEVVVGSSGGGGSKPGFDPSKLPTLDTSPSGWPLNGNMIAFKPEKQDNLCTTGLMSSSMNGNPAVLSCCQAHDNCYALNQCNATSWIPNPLPWGVCNGCNATAAACITRAVIGH